MCFSATASFVAGGALSVVGGLTLSQAKTKKELPFASIPLLFGIQQAIEGVVWISFGTLATNTVATYAYSLFSHVLWPILIPLSVLLIETDSFRKKILRFFFITGLVVGTYLLYFIIVDPVTAHVVDNSIAYRSTHLYPFFITSLYLIATCGSCLFSSHRTINIFGTVLFVSFVIAAWFYAETFFSVWCFFAAILSVLVYGHLKRKSIF